MSETTDTIQNASTVDVDATAGQVQKLLDFHTELTAANPKVLKSHMALTPAEAYSVLIEDIRELEDFNLRLNTPDLATHIRNIANSMLTEGVYADKPLAGYGAMRDGKPVIYITDGYCRFAAAKLAISEGAEIESLHFILKDKSTAMEDLTIAMIRTAEGKRLSPLEIAIGCKRLMAFNMKVGDIAKRLNVTPEYVSQLLTLVGSPKAIRDMVQNGEATAAVALNAIRQHGENATKVLTNALENAKAQGKTKVTASRMPMHAYQKAVKSAAPVMHTAITRIKTHEAFSALPEDLRTMIDEILAKVPEKPSSTDASEAAAAGTAA